jgi:sporulation protein YlmC with PRC-barrel domain
VREICERHGLPYTTGSLASQSRAPCAGSSGSPYQAEEPQPLLTFLRLAVRGGERARPENPTFEETGKRDGVMRLSDDNLRGRTVIGADGVAVGEISALFLDSEAWSVESLRVKLRKEIADQLGASRTMFHAGMVEIPIRLIQSVGDAVVLSVPVDGLREVLPGAGAPASAH